MWRQKFLLFLNLWFLNNLCLQACQAPWTRFLHGPGIISGGACHYWKNPPGNRALNENHLWFSPSCHPHLQHVNNFCWFCIWNTSESVYCFLMLTAIFWSRESYSLLKTTGTASAFHIFSHRGSSDYHKSANWVIPIPPRMKSRSSLTGPLCPTRVLCITCSLFTVIQPHGFFSGVQTFSASGPWFSNTVFLEWSLILALISFSAFMFQLQSVVCSERDALPCCSIWCVNSFSSVGLPQFSSLSFIIHVSPQALLQPTVSKNTLQFCLVLIGQHKLLRAWIRVCLLLLTLSLAPSTVPGNFRYVCVCVC